MAFITADGEKTVADPQKEMKICAFLWTYFGYTTSIYEGRNVELMRNRNGELLAQRDGDLDVDYVAGVPGQRYGPCAGIRQPVQDSVFQTADKVYAYMAEKLYAAESESKRQDRQDEARACFSDNKG